jgi:selenocysteine-specific elongation factor
MISRSALDEARIAVRRHLETFHTANPLRPGMPTAALPNLLGMPAPAVEATIDSDPGIVRDGAMVRLSHFVVDRTGREQDWAAARRALEAAGTSVPRTSELDIDRELLHALIRDGEVVRISDDFVFLPSLIETIVGQMNALSDGFTVSEFKDQTGLSRKYAVPFLEWADRTGLTVRMGDTRRLRA